MAVAHADHLLQLQENLPADEMPPVWMWPFGKQMKEHLDRVLAARKAKYSGDDGMTENALLRRES